MDQPVTCSKCNTSNSPDAVKCSNCGFPFSRIKMERMEKFIEDIQHKTTIVESTNKQEPKNDTESDMSFVSKNPNQGFFQPEFKDGDDNSDAEDLSEMLDNAESTKNNQEFPIADENDGGIPIIANESDILHNAETKQPTENTKMQASEESGRCKKCGYILSDFSSLCPNCGHNNIPVSVTVRMPEKTQIMDKENEFHEQGEELGQNITGSYPDMRNKTEKYDPKRNLSGETNKTIAQQEHGTESSLNTGSNATMREEISDQAVYDGVYDKPAMNMDEVNEPKSKTRLEAIYLGQDSDQKMLINIPEDATSLNVNRTMIDPGDSTISSEDHAIIYKEGNSWKIKNKASNKAVFIQVNEVSTLKDGDIIMLGGDKFYLFRDDNQE